MIFIFLKHMLFLISAQVQLFFESIWIELVDI